MRNDSFNSLDEVQWSRLNITGSYNRSIYRLGKLYAVISIYLTCTVRFSRRIFFTNKYLPGKWKLYFPIRPGSLFSRCSPSRPPFDKLHLRDPGPVTIPDLIIARIAPHLSSNFSWWRIALLRRYDSKYSRHLNAHKPKKLVKNNET